MATKYLTSANWNYQYVVDTTKPFYRSMVNNGVVKGDFTPLISANTDVDGTAVATNDISPDDEISKVLR
jgi:hypothetical protein